MRHMIRRYVACTDCVKLCWLALLAGEWLHSPKEVAAALVLFAVLIPVTPVIYLVVAPAVAIAAGFRGEAPAEPAEPEDDIWTL